MKKEREKFEKSQRLRDELERMWKLKAAVAPAASYICEATNTTLYSWCSVYNYQDLQVWILQQGLLPRFGTLSVHGDVKLATL